MKKIVKVLSLTLLAMAFVLGTKNVKAEASGWKEDAKTIKLGSTYTVYNNDFDHYYSGLYTYIEGFYYKAPTNLRITMRVQLTGDTEETVVYTLFSGFNGYYWSDGEYDRNTNRTNYYYTFTCKKGDNYFAIANKNWTNIKDRAYISFSAKLVNQPIMKSAIRKSKTVGYVTWSKVSDVTGYQVYRSTSQKGKYTLLRTTKYNYLSNGNLKANQKYYYKVRAYKKIGSKTFFSNVSSPIVLK